MRRIFVGDIQGCLAELETLLSAVGFEQSKDALHPVGDLVNKGPDSAGVLDLLMDLDAQPVLGNHDLKWLDGGCIEDAGQERWLRSQPFVRVLDDVIQVHAGLHPHWSDWTEAQLTSLTRKQAEFAVTVRHCDRDGKRPSKDWPPPKKRYRPWHEFYEGKRRVAFGHWARQGLHVTDKVVGLDSGCVYGGQLSAWIAEEDRIVQVPGWRA